MMSGLPIRGHLVCGGRFHDFDYARLRLLQLLAEHEEVRVTVSGDYADTRAIARADFLVTYTCDVRPTPDQQDELRAFAGRRGRWLALHGSNAAFDVSRAGATARDDVPVFLDVLGSRFLAHPPPHAYAVDVARPDHPLVAGIEGFTTTDELYLMELADDVEVLLDTAFSGRAPGWAHEDWTHTARHPVAYRRADVYYLTLGHCRGHYDMQPLMDRYPEIERGSWEAPAFEELLRRAIRWAIGAL
jgi:hypothetical protein